MADTSHPSTHANRQSRWPWLVGGAVAVLLVAAGVAIAVLPNDTAGPERGTTLEDVVGGPSSFVGRSVTVSGRVAASTTTGPRALSLGDDISDQVLVLPAAGASFEAWPDPDDVVRVRGEVGIYSDGYLEQREDLTGWADDEFVEEFEGEPMIIVEQIETLE